MASVKTKLAVGIFVIIGFAFVAVAVIWLGLASRLEKGRFYAAYFNESVQGLSKDSPVKYRGVSIGRVYSLGVAPDDRLIEVIMKIETNMIPGKNIVAELKSVGITGIMYLELDQRNPNAPDLSPHLSFKPPYPVIPTQPSTLEELVGGISEIVNSIKALDFKGISMNIEETLAQINRAVADLDTAGLSHGMKRTMGNIDKAVDDLNTGGLRRNLQRSLKQIDQSFSEVRIASQHVKELTVDARQTVARANGVVGTAGAQFSDTLMRFNQLVADLRSAVADADRLMQTGNTAVERTDLRIARLSEQLQSVLANLKDVGENLSRFSEQISTQPSQLLFSKPPPRQSKPGTR